MSVNKKLIKKIFAPKILLALKMCVWQEGLVDIARLTEEICSEVYCVAVRC